MPCTDNTLQMLFPQLLESFPKGFGWLLLLLGGFWVVARDSRLSYHGKSRRITEGAP